MRDDEDEQAAREKLAAELVAEALHSFENLITAEEAQLMRAMLEAELLTTAAGQRMLRAVAETPAVDSSGKRAKPGASARVRGKTKAG